MTDHPQNRPQVSLDIETGLREAVAHRRGEMALETCRVETVPAADPEAVERALAGVGEGD